MQPPTVMEGCDLGKPTRRHMVTSWGQGEGQAEGPQGRGPVRPPHGSPMVGRRSRVRDSGKGEGGRFVVLLWKDG